MSNEVRVIAAVACWNTKFNLAFGFLSIKIKNEKPPHCVRTSIPKIF